MTRIELLERVLEAARKIHHWHDAMRDNSGMVVSSAAVRELWEAIAAVDAQGAIAPSLEGPRAEGANAQNSLQPMIGSESP